MCHSVEYWSSEYTALHQANVCSVSVVDTAACCAANPASRLPDTVEEEEG